MLAAIAAALTCAVAASGTGATIPLLRITRPRGLVEAAGPGTVRGARDYMLRGGVRASVPIINAENIELVSEFQFGSPGQTTLLQLDTGSTDAWTVNQSAAAVSVPRHRGFDAARSSTFVDESYAVELSYGSGSLSVAVGRDSLGWFPSPSVGGVARGVRFGVTVNGGGWAANGWDGFPSDGILGLGMGALCSWRDCGSLAWQQVWAAAGSAPVFSLLTTSKADPIPSAGGAAAGAEAVGPSRMMAEWTARFGAGCRGCGATEPDRQGVSVRRATSLEPPPSLQHAHALDAARAGGPGRGPRWSAEQLASAASRPGLLMASSQRQSMLTLGGVNASHAADGARLYTLPLTTTSEGAYGFYSVSCYGLEVGAVQAPTDDDPGGQPQPMTTSYCPEAEPCDVIVDSGTTMLVVPPDPYTDILSGIDAAAGGACVQPEPGLVLCPSATTNFALLPNVTLLLDVSAVTDLPAGSTVAPPAPKPGHRTQTYSFVLPGAMLLDCSPGWGPGECRVAVMSSQSGAGTIQYILGDTFLRAWVAAFDARSSSVSLARSVVGPEPRLQPAAVDPALVALAVVGGAAGACALAALAWFAVARLRQRRQERARATLADMDQALIADEDAYMGLVD